MLAGEGGTSQSTIRKRKSPVLSISNGNSLREEYENEGTVEQQIEEKTRLEFEILQIESMLYRKSTSAAQEVNFHHAPPTYQGVSNERQRTYTGPVDVDEVSLSSYDESMRMSSSRRGIIPMIDPEAVHNGSIRTKSTGRSHSSREFYFDDLRMNNNKKDEDLRSDLQSVDTTTYKVSAKTGFILASEVEDDLRGVEEDIYSLVHFADFYSQAFVFAVLVFTFQFFFILIIFYNLVDFSNEVNPLQVPAGVALEVSVAQALAMILAVATQGDVLLSVTAFMDTHSSRATGDAVSCFRWFLSGFGRFLSGAFMTVDVFVLIVQSPTVMSLMLTFAGLQFVQEIDNVAFTLAKNGFISDTLQENTKKISRYRLPKRGKTYNGIRRVLYFTVTAALLSGWGYITYQQRSGNFLCGTIYAQFGDQFNPALGYLSGKYTQTGSLINHRVVYEEIKRGSAKFAYCEAERAWTFSRAANDPCDYLAKSSPTTTFDVTETTHAEWQVVDYFQTMHVHPFDHFSLICDDCESVCYAPNGECVDGHCECFEDRFGDYCEFHYPCPKLNLDLRTKPFPIGTEVSDLAHGNEYTMLLNSDGSPVIVYDRPVYTHGGEGDLLSVILFLGRRWVLTIGQTIGLSITEVLEREHVNFTTGDEIVPILNANFHGLFSGYTATFVSDPTDYGTASDGVTPAGLQWHRARYISELNAFWADETQNSGTVLLCEECDKVENDCFNVGLCGGTTEGVCDCYAGYDGYLCEREHLCTDEGIECLHGAQCDALSGVCDCPPGFFGPLCQF